MNDSGNGWSREVKRKIRKQKRESLSYKLMHEDTSHLYTKYDMVFSVVSISLATLTASGSIGSTTFNKTFVYEIGTGIILYIIAFITALNGYFNWSRISEKHKIYSLKYLWLHNNIYNQLSLKIEDRDDGNEYMKWLDDEFNNYLSESPSIPNRIKNRIYTDNPILEQDNRNLFEAIETPQGTSETPEDHTEIEYFGKPTKNVIIPIKQTGGKTIRTARGQYELNRLADYR